MEIKFTQNKRSNANNNIIKVWFIEFRKEIE
jgi:hypothetical protein